MNTYGLYVNGKDIQRYVNDYHDYGVDYMGEDNECADDKVSIASYDGTNIVATHHNLQITANPIQSLAASVSLRDFYVSNQSSRVVCIRPPLDKVSSDTPNGERMEQDARRASAS